jgi:CHAD domain-containing protein
MPYRLKRKRSVPKELRRIVAEQLETAVSELNKSGTVAERSVHEARKSIKKIRAAIRLMRDELGSSYRDENRFLGDVGRSLSDLRDASVLVASLESLGTRTQNRETKACLKKLATEFRTRQQQMANDKHLSAIVEAAARQLQSVAQRVHDWPCSKKGFDGLRTGCKRTLQRTRDAFEQVQKSGTPQHLHDWRKRVKDHWYHTRLLSKLWPDVMTSFESTLNDLETKLGDHHNLQVLKERIEALENPGCGNSGRTAVLQLITNEQTRLAKESTAIGERLYSVNADQEFRNIEQLWHRWRKRSRHA